MRDSTAAKKAIQVAGKLGAGALMVQTGGVVLPATALFGAGFLADLFDKHGETVGEVLATMVAGIAGNVATAEIIEAWEEFAGPKNADIQRAAALSLGAALEDLRHNGHG